MKPKSKKKPAQLNPVGTGSFAHRHGYEFDILVGWLEDIADNEQEVAERKPRYQESADKLSGIVAQLNQLI